MNGPTGRAQGIPIIVPERGEAQTLAKLAPETSLSEDRLQELIHGHPEILPIGDIEPGFSRLVPVCRELGTKHGPIDNLLMTAEGDIVLVEVKLWRNPESRRKVVAQALDYASCLFEMDYSELEHAVLRARGDDVSATRLFDVVVSSDDPIEEARFVDAVNINLRRGRLVILVVGDGIRSETERLAALVQSHAGAHFTFALVELTAYRLPEAGGLIICPRTLGRTKLIERAVVHINDARVRVSAPTSEAGHQGGPSAAPRPSSISAEQFFEEIAKLDSLAPNAIRTFLDKLEPIGVYEEYKARLILRWDSPDDVPINLGMFHPGGKISTRAVNWFVPRDIGHVYIEELASAWGLDVNRSHDRDWYVMGSDGRPPKIFEIRDRLPLWIPVIEKFQQRLRDRHEKDGGESARQNDRFFDNPITNIRKESAGQM